MGNLCSGGIEPSISTNNNQGKTTTNNNFNDWDGTETGEEIKILLLGSGECGKSTIFRQISNILSQLKTTEIKGFIPSIYENLWKTSSQIILSCKKRDKDKPFEYDETSSAADQLVNFDRDFSEFKDDCGYNHNVYKSLLTLWKDPKVIEVFKKYRGIDFHIIDGAD